MSFPKQKFYFILYLFPSWGSRQGKKVLASSILPNSHTGVLSQSNSLWPHGVQLSRLLCPRGFSGKNTGWSVLPFHPQWDIPNAGIEPTSPASPTLESGFFTISPPGEKNPKCMSPSKSVFSRTLLTMSQRNRVPICDHVWSTPR